MTFQNISRHFLFIVATMGACQNAIAVSPLKSTVKLEVPFSVGSSVVPEASAAVINGQASCMATISLEVVIIKSTGDSSPSKLDGSGQMKLAAERANALRALFLGLGVPDWRIYTEASGTVRPPYIRQPSGFEGGFSQIEYIGLCVGNADCQVLCKGERQ